MNDDKLMPKLAEKHCIMTVIMLHSQSDSIGL